MKATKDKADVLALARAAGLDKAVDHFPQDVAAAALSAVADRDELPILDDVAAEPWPPMRVRKGQ